MRILVVGSGAREHAIIWRLFSSPVVREVYCTPGNAGTAILAHSINIRHDDVGALAEWALREQIDLTFVGPEAPLALGIVDRFTESGLTCIGPTRAAAQIEWSKVWAKEMMLRAGVPTPLAEVVESPAAALDAVRRRSYPVVIKADGLAAGKGVFVARNEHEAKAAITTLMVDRTLGAAADQVLIEEHLEGDEISVLAFTDGRDLAVMPPARDYKRAGDGDVGPNTGGMGAFAPVPYVGAALRDRIRDTILAPTIEALAADGRPYKGVLYAGLMLTADGPMVLEFNCRFGDPEAQAILPLLESDLAMVLRAINDQELARIPVEWSNAATCVVVAASDGYPGEFRTGLPIRRLDSVESGALIFHGGTRRDKTGRHVITAGGRVLSVVGRGADLALARAQAYRGLSEVGFDNMQFRRDIAVVPSPRVWGVPKAAPTRLAPISGSFDRAAIVASAPVVARPIPASGQTEIAASLAEAFSTVSGGATSPQLAASVVTIGVAKIGIVLAGRRDRDLVEIVRAESARAGIETEIAQVDPYRAPEQLRAIAAGAADRQVRVLIAIAAVAPHLPSLLAGMTTLPVIGVGAKQDDSTAWESLRGLMALSGGMPVALSGMGETGARGAASLALAILALSDAGLAERYAALRLAAPDEA